MRFASLHLERYGAFTDRLLTFRAGARVHIVHGANEAGKTSSLSAIGDLLFGFGKTTPYAFAHGNTALRLGAGLQLGNGEEIAFRRRKGNANTLVDGNDKPLGDDLLARVTGNFSRKDFESEFGLTAEALRSGGRALIATGGRLAEMLAASSAGLSALSRQALLLEGEANALYGERKVATKPFYEADKRYYEANTALGRAIVTAAAWKDANQAVETAQLAAAGVEAGQKAVAGELARVERIKRVHPILRRLDARRAEVQQLASLPETALHLPAIWRAALAEDGTLAGQLAELDADHAGATRALEALAIDPALLAAAAEIEKLRDLAVEVRKAGETDLPRRVKDHDEAHDKLAEAARRLGLPDVPALLARFPGEAPATAARKLATQRKLALQGLEQAQAEEKRHGEALRRFGLDRPGEAHIVDPAPLKRRLEALAAIPADADRWRRDGQGVIAEEQQLADALARLNPAIASLAALARLPLPDAVALATARQHAEALEREAALLQAERAALAAQMANAEREIAQLTAQGAVASRDGLLAARQARDVALARLEAALDAALPERAARLDTARALGQRADDMADQLLQDGDRAVRRLLAGQKLAEEQRASAVNAAALAGLDQRQAETALAWQALWQPCALVPLEPARMIDWHAKATGLLQGLHGLAQRRVDVASLRAGLDEKRPALEALAGDLGLPVRAATPLDVLYREAQAALAERVDFWSDSRARAEKGKMLAANLADAALALQAAQAKASASSAEWPGMMAPLGLSEADPSGAENALEIWASAVDPRVRLLREQRSIDTINADLAAFEAATRALLAQTAPDLVAHPAKSALQTLLQRLDAARQTHAERDHMLKAGSARLAKREELARKQARARAAVAQAQAHLPDVAEIGQALDLLELRQGLRSDIAECSAQLLEAAGGHAEAHLRDEIASLDFDETEAVVAALNTRAGAANAAYGEAIAALRQAELARTELSRGRNAAGLLQARGEAGDEMARIGTAWLTRTLAVRLARAAIRQHRERAQDPVISAASAMFATVTSGGFAGLATDYGDNDQPVLVGKRLDGSAVKFHEMSEGTADQLFLVLRLALLAQRGGEALPFIGDDLLASFDEVRSGHMLDVLGEVGARQQVILFTHHAHIAEMARARLGTGADVIAL